MGFHPKTAISRNKDERPCKVHELRGVSSLILDFEAVRMNALKPRAGIAPKPRSRHCPEPRDRQCPETRSRHCPETKEPAMPRNQGPSSTQAKGPVIAALAALPVQKTESRRNLFSLRLSAIPCLLTCFSDHIRIISVFAYFAFLLIVAMPVAVIPLISSSASHRMELLVSPVLGSFVFPVLSEAEAAAAFFSHTAV